MQTFTHVLVYVGAAVWIGIVAALMVRALGVLLAPGDPQDARPDAPAEPED